VIPELALSVAVVAVAAWDGWRRYLARTGHRDADALRQVPALADRLEKAEREIEALRMTVRNSR